MFLPLRCRTGSGRRDSFPSPRPTTILTMRPMRSEAGRHPARLMNTPASVGTSPRPRAGHYRRPPTTPFLLSNAKVVPRGARSAYLITPCNHKRFSVRILTSYPRNYPKNFGLERASMRYPAPLCSRTSSSALESIAQEIIARLCWRKATSTITVQVNVCGVVGRDVA